MNAPAVSVVMAVFRPDRTHFDAALRSVLTQSMSDVEVIVVEDPPYTPELLAGWDDRRIRLVRQEEPGRLGRALNRGLSEARAELVARMDADDVAMPQRFAKQMAFLESHPDVGVYGSRISVIDASGRVVGHRRYPLSHDEIVRALRQYNAISHPAVMFRRRVVLDRGGYDESIKAEDYDLWCRLANGGVRFENAKEELTAYRFHAGASKFRAVHDDIRTTIAIKLRHFSGRMTVSDRLRLLGERVLLRMPPRMVIELFRRLVYR